MIGLLLAALAHGQGAPEPPRPQSRQDSAARTAAGDAYFASGALALARDSYEAALELAPSGRLHLQLMRCYQGLSQPDLALAHAVAAARLPGDAAAEAAAVLPSLAATQLAAPEALALLAEALPLSSPADRALALAAAYTEQQRHREAAAVLAAALAAAPLHADAPTWQAAIAQAHQQRRAIAAEGAALERLAEDFGQGSAWAEANPEQAAAAAVMIEARLAATIDRLAASASRSPDKTGQAITSLGRLYTTWLVRFPSHPDAAKMHTGYGSWLSEQGRDDEAYLQHMAAFDADPTGPLAEVALLRAFAALDHLLRTPLPAQARTPQPLTAPMEQLAAIVALHRDRFADSSALQVQLAGHLSRRGHFTEARALLAPIIASDPATATRAARLALNTYILEQDWQGARQAALDFSQTPGLGDDAFAARLAEVLSQTEGVR